MMKRGDGEPMNRETQNRYVIVSDDALDRVVAPLTVVHGRVQLLRRHFERNQAIGNDELDQALTHLEEATRTMIAEVSDIMGVSSHFRGSWDPE